VSVINPVAREISAKVVFYGPGLSGKTTTLQRIYSAVKPERRGEMISLATETDRTIFFDFLPLHAQSVRGLTVRFALYTVPGQVFYGATRKLVLNGADGVVFVADSQESCADRNVESFESLRQNLNELGADVERFPIVFQFNKRDLPTAMPVSVMSGMLNFIDAPEFATNAVSGEGILALLRAITQSVMTSVAAQHPAPTRPDTDRTLHKPRPAKAAPDGIASSVFAATARMVAAPLVAKSKSQPLSAPLEKDKGWTIVPGPATEPPGPGRTTPSPAPSAPVPAGITFAPLWPAERAEAVQAVEKLIASGDHAGGVSSAAQLLGQLLDDLPGPHGADRTSKALLLGIDGREYLRVCRLADGPRDRVTVRDALLALHLLIAAQVRAAGV
jgi:signal recognition particle receptor subunit beta